MDHREIIADPVEALAESWASIDGKLQRFRDDKAAPITSRNGMPDGTHQGYMAEAATMIERLRYRGWVLVRG